MEVMLEIRTALKQMENLDWEYEKLDERLNEYLEDFLRARSRSSLEDLHEEINEELQRLRDFRKQAEDAMKRVHAFLEGLRVEDWGLAGEAAAACEKAVEEARRSIQDLIMREPVDFARLLGRYKRLTLDIRAKLGEEEP
jgi:DNA repair exonuclease SbcCD ATPase subunit